jgi:hypothetical protein
MPTLDSGRNWGLGVDEWGFTLYLDGEPVGGHGPRPGSAPKLPRVAAPRIRLMARRLLVECRELDSRKPFDPRRWNTVHAWIEAVRRKTA